MSPAENYMQIIKYSVGDIIQMKKAHPCGCSRFKVLRVGSEMRVVCLGCSRDMTVDRIKLEKATKKILAPEDISDK